MLLYAPLLLYVWWQFSVSVFPHAFNGTSLGLSSVCHGRFSDLALTSASQEDVKLASPGAMGGADKAVHKHQVVAVLTSLPYLRPSLLGEAS